MTDITQRDKKSIETLRAIMAALRTPGTGCPWDLEQDFTSIAPYTLEEAYEVADAIERQNLPDLCEELGDLLLQVIYHAQMAQELGAFSLDDVIEAISTKMIRRHPHVFGTKDERGRAPEKGFWERLKASERANKSSGTTGFYSILSDTPLAAPALTRALKLQKKAARVGFDWSQPEPILEKISEETEELMEAQKSGNPDNIEEEFGDLLFCMVNLARHMELDPETSLRRANRKFYQRFSYIERTIQAQGRRLEETSLEEMDQLWSQAKAEER